MKLESLKSSKFEAFKGHELLNIMNVIGGRPFLTRKAGTTDWTDCWDDSTPNDIHAGNGYDVCKTAPIHVTGTFNETTDDGEEFELGFGDEG